MRAITTGLDIAKSLFQVHRVDTDGQVAITSHFHRAGLTRYDALS
jgi:hypothetical protein